MGIRDRGNRPPGDWTAYLERVCDLPGCLGVSWDSSFAGGRDVTALLVCVGNADKYGQNACCWGGRAEEDMHAIVLVGYISHTPVLPFPLPSRLHHASLTPPSAISVLHCIQSACVCLGTYLCGLIHSSPLKLKLVDSVCSI